MKDITVQTYKINYTCVNCGHSDTKLLVKGYEVMSGFPCSYCGCIVRNGHKPTNKFSDLVKL